MSKRLETYWMVIGTVLGTWLALVFMVAMTKLTSDLWTAVFTCG